MKRSKEKILVVGIVVVVSLVVAVLPYATVYHFGNAPSYYLQIIVWLLILLFACAVLFIFFGTNYYRKKSQGQELIIEKISSQYEGLQKQLSPHFLFNSLNVLESLIEENPQQAQEFTQELSKIYRYVLEQENKQLTTLGEELDFVKSYISLMDKRFEKGFVFMLDENIDRNQKILPLSIQLLLENVFKHNVTGDLKPLLIHIYQKDSYLYVTNTLNPKETAGRTSRKGLANIQARYQKLGLSLSVEKTGNQFIVKLPIMDKNFKITDMEHTVEQRERAERRVAELKKFYQGLGAYLFTCIIVTGINLMTSWNAIFNGRIFWAFWAFWVIVPWGLVILGKAVTLFWLPTSQYNWEEKKIKELMEKD